MNILGCLIDDEIELSIVAMRDCTSLFNLIHGSRERLGRWLGFVATTNEQSDVEAFVSSVRQAYAKEESYTFTIRYRGAIAGVVSIEVKRVQNCGEIGYWLGGGFEGKAIMTRAVKALSEFAFVELGLYRLVINVASPNEKSANVAVRSGFVLEGVARGASKVGDTYYDAKVFSRLSTDS